MKCYIHSVEEPLCPQCIRDTDRKAVEKFLLATGHDLCHENRRELARAFDLEDILPKAPESIEEFDARCEDYQKKIYGNTAHSLYECHLTMNCLESTDKKQAVEEAGKLDRWKYSAIYKDPILGDKIYSYLTTYDKDIQILKARMEIMLTRLVFIDVPVIRQKIEKIVFDTKHSL